MICIRITREYTYETGETTCDTYEIEYDQDGYNPSVVRDMRDCLISLMPDTPAETAELTEYEDGD